MFDPRGGPRDPSNITSLRVRADVFFLSSFETVLSLFILTFLSRLLTLCSLSPPLSMSQVPSLHRLESRTEARMKRLYANAHAYHINSISINR
jgi:hypothetical protein